MAGMQVNVDLRAGKDLAFAALKIVEIYVNDSGDKVHVSTQPDGALKFEFESDRPKAIEGKEKTAEWLVMHDTDESDRALCSRCGKRALISQYCSNCGAYMTNF